MGIECREVIHEHTFLHLTIPESEANPESIVFWPGLKDLLIELSASSVKILYERHLLDCRVGNLLKDSIYEKYFYKFWLEVANWVNKAKD